MAEYVGRYSCAAKREGWYVKKAPKSLEYYAALIWASLRDYRRGYKYDDTKGCRKVRCGIECLYKKLRFILLIAKRNVGAKKYAIVERWVMYAWRYKKLHPEAQRIYRKAIAYI